MNKFEISGYVATEPKVDVTSTGKKRATFTVANRVKKDQSQFIYVQVWDKTAELASNYAHKGEFIIVEGRISVYERTDATGRKNSQIQLVGDRIEIINTHRGTQNPTPAQAKPEPIPEPEITPDMLPF